MAAFAINAARADTARYAYRADSVNFATNSGHSQSSDYATEAGSSDSSSYSNFLGYAIHSYTAIYAWISLGYSHWSGVDSVLYTNGYWGVSKGGAGVGLIGDSSHTMVNIGVVCTTGTLGQSYYYSTIGGGFGNKARKNYVTIGGGTANNAVNDKSTIAGDAGFVGGGQWNNASEDYTTIAGGYSNAAAGIGASSLGGIDNHANSTNATIAGGTFNTVTNADANGDCGFNGIDVTYSINYLKGFGAEPHG